MVDKLNLTHHISQKFNEELEDVRNRVLAMGGLVEQQIVDALKALTEGDSTLGRAIEQHDYKVNQMEVTIRWSMDDAGVRLSVSDTGVGIAAEHIPRLTERFYRVDRSRSRDSGGTGLGLAIVKHVLQRHDADLEVESEPGKGSIFTCRFPLERVAREARTA